MWFVNARSLMLREYDTHDGNYKFTSRPSELPQMAAPAHI